MLRIRWSGPDSPGVGRHGGAVRRFPRSAHVGAHEHDGPARFGSARRSISAGRASRSRRDVSGLARVRRSAGASGRGQGPAPVHQCRPLLPATTACGGAGRGAAQPPAHHQRVRLRRGHHGRRRTRAVRRHGARRRRVARRGAGPCPHHVVEHRCPDQRRRGRRPGRRTRARDRAPRRHPGQRHAHPVRGEGGRLRHLRPDRGERHRRRRQPARHPGLPGARAARGRPGQPGHRRLRGRPADLPDADRPAPVGCRHHHRAAARPPVRGARPAPARRGPAARGGRPGRPLSGEAPRGPAADRRGRARAGRDRGGRPGDAGQWLPGGLGGQRRGHHDPAVRLPVRRDGPGRRGHLARPRPAVAAAASRRGRSGGRPAGQASPGPQPQAGPDPPRPDRLRHDRAAQRPDLRPEPGRPAEREQPGEPVARPNRDPGVRQLHRQLRGLVAGQGSLQGPGHAREPGRQDGRRLEALVPHAGRPDALRPGQGGADPGQPGGDRRVGGRARAAAEHHAGDHRALHEEQRRADALPAQRQDLPGVRVERARRAVPPRGAALRRHGPVR